MRYLQLMWLAFLTVLCSCSLYLPIRVKNTSDAAITLTYKIQPLGWEGLLHEEVLIVTADGMDTTRSRATLNKADSVITLTLLPGEEAIVGAGVAHRNDRLLSDGTTATCCGYDRDCMNLYWMRIAQNGVEHTYTSEELLNALRKRRIPLTLITDEARK